MKKSIVSLFVLFVSMFLYSHAPTDVIIEYDAVKNIINVDVKHNLQTSPAQDPKKHYIKTIVLKVNGKTVKTNNFEMQDAITEQKTFFDNITVEKGNKITVEAVCNLIGAKSGTMVVK